MQYTQNYNFDLPEANDDLETASRTALNDNFTALDTLLKDVEDDIDDVQDDISGLNAKTGDDIPFESGSADSISDKITILDNSVGNKPSGETDTLWDKVDTLENRDTYSTTEQIIGTWIDGKPIYRKVITGLNATLTSGAWANLVNVSSLNIDSLVSCRLYRGGVGALTFYQIITPFEVEMSSGYIRAWDTSTDGSISKCILEYTKTTD